MHAHWALQGSIKSLGKAKLRVRLRNLNFNLNLKPSRSSAEAAAALSHARSSTRVVPLYPRLAAMAVSISAAIPAGSPFS
jgi:hypothetical protein